MARPSCQSILGSGRTTRPPPVILLLLKLSRPSFRWFADMFTVNNHLDCSEAKMRWTMHFQHSCSRQLLLFSSSKPLASSSDLYVNLVSSVKSLFVTHILDQESLKEKKFINKKMFFKIWETHVKFSYFKNFRMVLSNFLKPNLLKYFYFW